MENPIWSACHRLGFRPTEAEVKSFVAAYPPPTLFGYIDATSLAEGRAKEVSILASALKTVLKSPAAAVTNDALAPMLRAGMAHASGAVRACRQLMRSARHGM